MNENKDLREEVTNETEGGKINISNDVIASIAGIAAMEIEGVAGMAGNMALGLAEKLGGKKNPQKGVKVTVSPEGAMIDLLINVAFGVRIPELCWEIQENVKNSVESMTGTDVIRVNVFVEGVSFEKKKKAPKPEDLIDDDAEEADETAEVLEVTEE